jgi:putative nucleotidyltransferase with HDIG domain
MHKLCIVSDLPSKATAIRVQLEGLFDTCCLDVDSMRDCTPPSRVLFDIDFSRSGQALQIKEWLKHKRTDATVIFIVDKASRLQTIQAMALGATGIVSRPFGRAELIRLLLGTPKSLVTEDASPEIQASPGIIEAFHSLRGIFETACLGAPLDMAAINSTGEAVINRMEANGLGSWLDTVRKHHSQTYQHCLIVAGVTVGFAQHVGFSRADQLRLLLGAMLHDIGKARIPLEILEKPAALTGDEVTTMRNHPEYGLEALKSSSGLNPELLDIVVHHHEYLDGSGYPHGLSGSEISDPVRILTICDVFGALMERRAYKPPLGADAAYRILLEMGGRLDQDLVRAFGFAKGLSLDKAA